MTITRTRPAQGQAVEVLYTLAGARVYYAQLLREGYREPPGGEVLP